MPPVPCLHIFGFFEAIIKLKQRVTPATYDRMEIEFAVMLWIVPNKWCDLLVVMPPGCGTIPPYENLKFPASRESLCYWPYIQMAQNEVIESVPVPEVAVT